MIIIAKEEEEKGKKQQKCIIMYNVLTLDKQKRKMAMYTHSTQPCQIFCTIYSNDQTHNSQNKYSQMHNDQH